MVDSEQLAALFAEGLGLADARARSAWVFEQAGENTPLANELLALFKAHDASADFLEVSAIHEAATLLPNVLGAELVGQTLGPWRIEELIETGGMGSVYLAVRSGEGFTQRGALKLVKVGFESPELLARFSRERQLLAQVEHPHIARLLDGGTTENGLPWLVMDYVDGESLATYADRHRLSLGERLALFDQIADAIAYLHENLITHRDLKVSNVLVDEQGRARVLDFGIASLLGEASPVDDDGAERRLSLASASPEQIRKEPISTATDVYALGLLLYRCLTGVAPYRVSAGMDWVEVERLICDEVPPLANVAVATDENAAQAARLQGTSSRTLIATLRGDLDAILAKALAKDPRNRYRSVTELRADLSRFTERRPVSARADTAWYRTQKFLQRHWKGFFVTVAAGTLLSLALLLALYQADEARQQRDQAQSMNAFMQEVLADADPYTASSDRTVREALTEASKVLEDRFRGKPELEASLRQVVGRVQTKLMDLDAGEANIQRALTLLNSEVSDDVLELHAQADLAWILYERESYAESIRGYQSIIERFSQRTPANLKRLVYNDLGVAFERSGQYEAAIDAFENSLLYVGENQRERAATLINMGYAYGYLEQYETAEAYYLEAIGLLHSLGNAGESAALAFALNNYGRVLDKLGRTQEALTRYEESLALRVQVFGAESYAVGTQHLNIGRIQLDLGLAEAAREHLTTATQIIVAHREPNSTIAGIADASLGRAIWLCSRDPAERSRAVDTISRVEAEFVANGRANLTRFVEQFGMWLDEAEGEVLPQK